MVVVMMVMMVVVMVVVVVTFIVASLLLLRMAAAFIAIIVVIKINVRIPLYSQLLNLLVVQEHLIRQLPPELAARLHQFLNIFRVLGLVFKVRKATDVRTASPEAFLYFHIRALFQPLWITHHLIENVHRVTLRLLE